MSFKLVSITKQDLEKTWYPKKNSELFVMAMGLDECLVAEIGQADEIKVKTHGGTLWLGGVIGEKRDYTLIVSLLAVNGDDVQSALYDTQTARTPS